MAKSPVEIWADGPVASPTQPNKQDIRDWALWMEGQVDPDATGTGVDFAADLTAHINDKGNPHDVTADQLGLGDVNERIGVNVPLYGDRPGDSPHNFVDTLTSGDPVSLPEIAIGVRASDENGRVRRLTGAGIVATRALYPLEPNKVYLVEFVVQRRIDTPDPSNDAVRCALAWYNQGQGVNTPAFFVVRDITTLVVGSGRVVVTALVARTAGESISIVAPAGARYARPYVQTYGTSTVTDVEVMRWVDITNASEYSPDLTALEGRVSSIESLDLGPRVEVLEEQVTAPNSVRIATVGDLAATLVPVSADTVHLLAFSEVGDGGEANYVRVAAEPSHAGKVQSADGAWWELRADIVDIRMFGANKNRPDNTAQINNAIAYAVGKELFIPPYRYVTTGLLNGVSGIAIRGVRGKSEIYSPTLPSGGSLLGVRQLQFSGVSGFSVKDVLFNASDLTPTAGMRCIWVMDCTDYTIEDSDFETPGAAVASIRSSNYMIRHNRIDLISPTGLPYHDGIIDQWDGCHDFRVIDNDIDGHNIGKYGVLVTGQATDGTANACHDFDIEDNHVQRVSQLGIWDNGRNGINYAFKIAGNQVKNVTAFHGIAVSDSRDGRVYGNLIDGVAGNGVRLFSETGAGGTFGTSNIALADNVIKNTNQAGSGSSTDGAAIAIVNTSTNGTVSGNVVDGTQHTYALSLGASTSNINAETNAFVAGTLGTTLDSGASNYVIEKPKAAFYIPTLTGITNVSAATTAQARYERKNSIVRMGGSVTVTPTAGSSGSPVRTQINISLPIASNLTSTANDLAGTAASTFGHVGGLSADTTNKVATLSFMANSTSAVTLYYEFEYTVK